MKASKFSDAQKAFILKQGADGEAEKARRRSVAGPGDASGRHSQKVLRPARKRKLVAGICQDWDVSIRRACRVLELDTSTYHHKSRRPKQAGLEASIKEICATRVRYRYRRVHVLLRLEGWCLPGSGCRDLREPVEIGLIRVLPVKAEM